MDRLQILKDYVNRRNIAVVQDVENLRKQFQSFKKDIKEIIELQEFLDKNNISIWENANHSQIAVFWVNHNDLVFQIRKPCYTGYFLYVDKNGKYSLVNEGGFKQKMSYEMERSFLYAFCYRFPDYRDSFFEDIESFQTKEV